MDQELIAYLDARFREINQQIAGLREETAQRLEKVEDEIRQAHVRIESVRDEIRLLAEGVMSSEKKLQAFRAEVKQEFDEARSLMRSAYAQVDRRVHSLEAWRERKERDPIDLIRERYGKTGTSG
jgi:predicted  nucleic acid-binding Zn-ribbon protein